MPTRKDQAKSKWHSPQTQIVTSRKGTWGRIPALYDEARQLYLPMSFETEFRVLGQPLVILEHEAFPREEGKPVTPACVRMEVKAANTVPPGVITTAFRPPLAKYMRYAVAAAAARIETFLPQPAGEVKPWTSTQTFAELLRRRPGRPRLEETLDLEEVAAAYRSGGRKGIKALMDHWAKEHRWISHRTAARYADRAREAGLI